jgi:iron complex transport system ATP-binding protein
VFDLSVNQITVTTGGRIKDISFQMTGGLTLAIAGPNGAGKSTLLRAVAALTGLVAGSVRLEGRDVSQMSPVDRARVISYLTQKPEVHWPLPVKDVVTLGLMPFGTRLDNISSDAQSQIDEQLKNFNLSNLANRSVTKLSGGEFQRVLLARALIGKPKVLIVDEPTTALDPGVQLDVMATLRKTAKSGAIVIYATHDIGHAIRFADRALLLNSDGSLVSFGKPLDVFNVDSLAKIFGIRPSGGEIKDYMTFERVAERGI